MRTWEVTVTGLAASGRTVAPRARRHAVCFDTTGTPRQGLLVDCCERAEGVFPDLADQDLALCLEAARHGGLLWVDPRDGELWWVQERDATLEMRSAASTVRVANDTGKVLLDLGDRDLTALLDGAVAI